MSLRFKQNFRPPQQLGMLIAAALVAVCPYVASGQDEREITPEQQAKVGALVDEILEGEIPLSIDPTRSKLMRTKRPVSRFSITNPGVLEIVQFSPTEFEIIGGEQGETTLTLWFGDPDQDAAVLRYVVTVARDTTQEENAEIEYGKLEDRINELFPNSYIHLIPIGTKLIVRGQARDSKEAAEILAILGGAQTNQQGTLLGYGSSPVSLGQAAAPTLGADDLAANNLINMLTVPGEQQIMLRVRIASLTRSAARTIGSNLGIMTGDFSFSSMLAPGGAFTAILNTDEVMYTLSAASQNSWGKVLAEPNLVTLSGRPASFNVGGEFAVPVVVGVGGAAAATTNFRSFGTSIFFTPTLIDKDLVRLQVTPSLTGLNGDDVNGIPSLNSTVVSTTVDLREGQWMAIAGLIEDTNSGSKARVPLLGDIPVVDTIFSRRQTSREETETLIMISPELVHPLDAEEAPLILPGMEVNEPTDWRFFLFGHWEGTPDIHHRSTVYPTYRYQIYEARFDALCKAKQATGYQKSQRRYVQGQHGFSH